MRRATNIDAVAAAAGVSTATVSRVFNRRGNVQEATRAEVLKAAHRLGYRPQMTAMRDCLAIAIEDFTALSQGGYNNMLISALCREISSRGHRIEMVTPAEIPVLGGKFCHGLISCLYEKPSLAFLQQFKALKRVSINASLPGIPAVSSNDAQGLEMAVGMLLDHGHRRLGLLARETGKYSNDQRRRGFLAAMAKAGRPVGDALIAEPGDSPEALVRLLKSGVTGLICASEEQGPMVYRELARLGCRVPDDLSVVAFEYHDISAILTPAQTTIAQDFATLASTALDLLEPAAGSPASSSVLVDYLKHERASVARPGPAIPPA